MAYLFDAFFKGLGAYIFKELNIFYKSNSPSSNYGSNFQKRLFQGLDLNPIF
jgi:hypothetical protein